MEEVLTVWEKFWGAVSSTKDAILNNLGSFSIIFLVYTLLLIYLCHLWHKHKRENLENWDENLKRRSQEIEQKSKELEEKLSEYDSMKAELSSQEYQAFLLSRGIHGRDLDDSKMFEKV